jgi:hypothetical protein
MDSQFVNPPLNTCDTGILLIARGGWGDFEALAWVYNSKRNEYEASVFNYVRNPQASDSHKEYSGLSQGRMDGPTWSGLIRALDSSGYWSTLLYANQCSGCVDCTNYTLLVKAGGQKKMVKWDGFYPVDTTGTRCYNKCREMNALGYKIFKTLNLPPHALEQSGLGN